MVDRRKGPRGLRDREAPEVEGHQAYAIGENGERGPVSPAPERQRSGELPEDVQGHVVEMVRRKEDGERK
ncbi:MAG TPA: hypothetical protein VFN19_03720 [Candidatus Nanopelagicales bacterium]|jgi:hypothetical protein|nr:hypothetical protein [Candidatus Nanopelagicales bacterium]